MKVDLPDWPVDAVLEGLTDLWKHKEQNMTLDKAHVASMDMCWLHTHEKDVKCANQA